MANFRNLVRWTCSPREGNRMKTGMIFSFKLKLLCWEWRKSGCFLVLVLWSGCGFQCFSACKVEKFIFISSYISAIISKVIFAHKALINKKPHAWNMSVMETVSQTAWPLLLETVQQHCTVTGTCEWCSMFFPQHCSQSVASCISNKFISCWFIRLSETLSAGRC